jgi:hypothetical protein
MVGMRSRLIRVRTSDGHIRCTGFDGSCTSARPASPVWNASVDVLRRTRRKRGYARRSRPGGDQRRSGRGARGSASLLWELSSVDWRLSDYLIGFHAFGYQTPEPYETEFNRVIDVLFSSPQSFAVSSEDRALQGCSSSAEATLQTAGGLASNRACRLAMPAGASPKR